MTNASNKKPRPGALPADWQKTVGALIRRIRVSRHDDVEDVTRDARSLSGTKIESLLRPESWSHIEEGSPYLVQSDYRAAVVITARLYPAPHVPKGGRIQNDYQELARWADRLLPPILQR